MGVLSKSPIYATKGQTVSAQEIVLRGKKVDSIATTVNGAWLINMLPAASVVDLRLNTLNAAIIDTADTLRVWGVNTFIQNEVDPIFAASPAHSISTPNVSTWNNTSNSVSNDSANWNTAFGWGNWALQGFITPSSANTLTNKSGNISMWANNVNYLTSITFSQVVGALAYTPINPNGSTLQYFRGDGSLATFPSIPAAQVQANYTETLTSATDYISNKPSLAVVATSGLYSSLSGTPTTVSSFTNDAGYITAASSGTLTNKSGNISQWTNNSGYLTSIPAQSFSSLTGKPTTLSGYGITDAYPLSGNPLNFISSVPAQSFASLTGKPTTFLGYGIVETTTDLPEGSNLYFTNSRSQQSWSLTATGSGVATYGGGILNIPTPSISTPSTHDSVVRALNANYTISTTKVASVCYSVNISISLSLTTTSGTGTLFLEYSINSGTSWHTLPVVQFNPALSLTGLLTLSLIQAQVVQINGWIPANALVRLRTTSSGTVTFTYMSGQEYY